MIFLLGSYIMKASLPCANATAKKERWNYIMQKSTFRLIALLVVLVLAIGVFAACKFGPEPEAPADDPTTQNNNNQSGNEQRQTDKVVTFVDADGNKTTVSVKESATVQAPAAPDKTGYRFLGWYAKDAAEPFDFSVAISADVELVAKYEQLVAWSEFFPKDVNFIFSIPSLEVTADQMVAPAPGDEIQQPTVGSSSTPVLMPGLQVVCGFDADGKLYGAISATSISVNLTHAEEPDTTDIHAFIEDGVAYVLVGSQNEEEKTTLRFDVAKLIEKEVLSKLLPAELVSAYNELAANDEYKWLTYGLPESLVTAANAAVPVKVDFDILLELFFTAEEQDDVTYYSLDFDKITAINNDLINLTVEQFIDKYFGYATFALLKVVIVRQILPLRVSDVVNLLAQMGITVDDLAEFTDSFSEGLGISGMIPMVVAMLDDPDFYRTEIVSLIGIDPDVVTGFLNACEENSFYALIELSMTPEEEPVVEEGNNEAQEPTLYEAVSDILSLAAEAVSYRFEIADGKFIGSDLGIALVQFMVDADTALTVDADFVLSFNQPFDMSALTWKNDVLQAATDITLDNVGNYERTDGDRESDYFTSSAITFSEDGSQITYSYEYISSFDGIGNADFSSTVIKTILGYAISPAKGGYFSVTVYGVGDDLDNYYVFRTTEDGVVEYAGDYSDDAEYSTEKPALDVETGIQVISFYYNPETGDLLNSSTYYNEIGAYDLLDLANAQSFQVSGGTESEWYNYTVALTQDASGLLTVASIQETGYSYTDEIDGRNATVIVYNFESYESTLDSTIIRGMYYYDDVYEMRVTGEGTTKSLYYRKIVFDDDPNNTYVYNDEDELVLLTEDPTFNEENGPINFSFIYFAGTSETQHVEYYYNI